MERRSGDTPSSPIFGKTNSLVIVALFLLANFLPLAEGPVKLLFVPFLVLVPIYFLTLRRQQGIGPVGAFVAGLLIDILTLGPLGLTAASFTIVHLFLRMEREALMALPAIFKFGFFAVAVGFVLGVAIVALEYLGPGGPEYLQVAGVLGAIWVFGILFDVISSAIGHAPAAKGARDGRAGLAGKPRRNAPNQTGNFKRRAKLGPAGSSVSGFRRKRGRRFGWLMRQS